MAHSPNSAYDSLEMNIKSVAGSSHLRTYSSALVRRSYVMTKSNVNIE